MVSRRDFLAKGAAAVGAFGIGRPGPDAAEAGEASRFPLIGFSKPFQQLDAEQTAELVATVGWDGIECPVRAKGQVEPERAPEELPKLAEALRRRQRDIHLVATDITSLQTPHAEAVMRTMAGLGIKRLRLGSFTYPPDGPPAERLKEIAPRTQGHRRCVSRPRLAGGLPEPFRGPVCRAPVWDVYSMIRSLDPRHMGFCFDIGHATVEGGLSWPVEARLAEPFYTAVIVKDFYWKKESAGWKDTWCPLGEGMVNRSFFERLKKSAYRGPICQHHEYDLGDTRQMTAHLQHDLKVLKEWLA